MKSVLTVLVGISLLLSGAGAWIPPVSWGANETPSYQYFDGSYYYFGNYYWKGTWYPAGWYLSPGTPAPPGYVSSSGWPAGGKSVPGAQPVSPATPETSPQAVTPGISVQSIPAPTYIYFDGRYYYYNRYFWNGQWYPSGWYAAPGEPAPAGYVSPTRWQPGVGVPPFEYYDGSYYYYSPYFWGGLWYPAGWYLSLGLAAPLGYISPTGWYFGLALALPIALFFDGFYSYYPRYFWNRQWYAAGWYARPGRPVPGHYVSPSGWRPGLSPSRFRPVTDMRPRAVTNRTFFPHATPLQRVGPTNLRSAPPGRVPRGTDRRGLPSKTGPIRGTQRHHHREH